MLVNGYYTYIEGVDELKLTCKNSGMIILAWS